MNSSSRPASLLFIVGPQGVGKSTLARMLAAASTPDRQVIVSDLDTLYTINLEHVRRAAPRGAVVIIEALSNDEVPPGLQRFDQVINLRWGDGQ